MPNWKKVIVSGSDAALNSLYAPSITGSLQGTASFALNSATASISNASSDIIILCLNQAGFTIPKGTVVRITGSNNASDIPRITTASYENDNNSANTLGIARETLTNGSLGYIITEGILTGIDTSNFEPGQLLHLGATGSIINSAPKAPLHDVRLGEVIRKQAVQGSIYVRIDNGYEIDELHDVFIDTGSVTDGDLLIRSGSIWTNSKQLPGSYAITGSLIVSSSSGVLTEQSARDSAGTPSISFNGRSTRDSSNITSIHWHNRQLYDAAGIISENWRTRLLYDQSASSSLDWDIRGAYDINGNISIDWAQRRLTDINQNPALSWRDRQLIANDASTISLNWDDPFVRIGNVYDSTIKPTQIQETISAGIGTGTEIYNYIGDIIIGTPDASLVDGQLCALDTDGIWYPVRQNIPRATCMLGIAFLVDTLTSVCSILLDGHVCVDTVSSGSSRPFVEGVSFGSPVYIQQGTAIGNMSTTIPTSGYVRTLGHCYYNNINSSNAIWIMKFRPSNDWYQI